MPKFIPSISPLAYLGGCQFNINVCGSPSVGCMMVKSRGALDGGAGAVEFTAVMDHMDEDLERIFFNKISATFFYITFSIGI